MGTLETSCPVTSLRLHRLLSIALLGLAFCPLLTGRVHGEEGATDPYDTLYDVIMVRKSADGKPFGGNEVGPLIFTAAQKFRLPKDFRYQTIAAGSGGRVDPIEGTDATSLQKMTPSLQGCIFCHTRSRAGVRSLGDFMHGDRIADRFTYEAGNPVKIAQGVAAIKRKHESWKKLQEFWRKE